MDTGLLFGGLNAACFHLFIVELPAGCAQPREGDQTSLVSLGCVVI